MEGQQRGGKERNEHWNVFVREKMENVLKGREQVEGSGRKMELWKSLETAVNTTSK